MIAFPNADELRYALLRPYTQLVDLPLSRRSKLDPKLPFPRSFH
jgi:hypothetical protein